MTLGMERVLRGVAAFAIAAVFAGPVFAELRKVVDGLVINVGVTPAPQLMRNDAYERSMHRDAAASATHHVVVGVADAKSGSPISDARVTLEIVDPRGATQRQTLERGDAGGYPDYSGLFRFGWSGVYKLRVNVARAGAAPVSSTFNWTQGY
jgi:hypothetical protein